LREIAVIDAQSLVRAAVPPFGHGRAWRHAARCVRDWLRQREAQRRWRQQGHPLPVPPHVKRALLRKRAQRNGLRVFIETGTLFGDTLAALRRHFEELHSIELDPELYRKAAARFANDPKVTLWHGDSGEVLPRVLEGVGQPVLFWLDGHYAGEGTARGAEDTPIRRELAHIARHALSRTHLIVVDDARLFDGRNHYPGLEDLQAYVATLGFGHMLLENDMILISGHPCL